MKGTRKRPRTGFRKWLYEFLTDTYTYRKGDGPLVTVSGHRHYSVDPREVLYILAKRGDLDGMPGFSRKTTEEKPDTKRADGQGRPRRPAPGDLEHDMERRKKHLRTGFRKWLYEFFTDTYTYRKGEDYPLVTVSGHRHYSVDPVEVLYYAAKRGDLDGMPGFSRKTTEQNPDKKTEAE